MLQKYLDGLLEVGTVKEGDEYVQGYYNNRVPVYGLYLKAKKDTILERVEIMAKGKFKLEADSENYAQEARVVFFEKLEGYLKEHGEPITEKEIDSMNALLYKSCANHMADIAKLMKSGSSICDRETGQFSIVHLLSLDAEDEFSQTLQGEVEDILSMKSKESFSHFRLWFNENKGNILTKKQLAYLEDEQIVPDPSNKIKINRAISERIYRSYTDNSIIKYRIEKIEHRKEMLTDIITGSNTDRQLIYKIVNKMKTETWLLESMYSLSFKTCSMLTNACKNVEYICDSESIIEIREELQRLYDYFSRAVEDFRKKL